MPSPSSSSSPRRDVYRGPAEDRDGEYDVDSTVYCTDLMEGAGASTTTGGGRDYDYDYDYDYDDAVTGWTEGGRGRGGRGDTPRNSSSEGAGRGRWRGLLGKKKKTPAAAAAGANANSNANANNRAPSGAAAIALAYNDFGDSSSSSSSTTEQHGHEGGDGAGESSAMSGGSGSLISSLASGGASKLGGRDRHQHPPHQPRPAPARESRLDRQLRQLPDWHDDDDDDDDESGSSEDDDDGRQQQQLYRHQHRHRQPTKKTKKSPPSSSKLTAVTTATARRRIDRKLTAAAVVMLFLGLSAVGLGVAYGMGLLGGSGGGGGKSNASGSSSGGAPQACARAGPCEPTGGGGDATTDPSSVVDDTANTVPTDRPTSPPLDGSEGGGGVCAAPGSKSQSCGAHNSAHPPRCCPGLSCADKVCTDPKKGEEDANAKEEITTEPTLEEQPEPTARPTSAAPTRPPTPNMWVSQPTSELMASAGEKNETAAFPPGHFTYDPADDLYGPPAWSDARYAATTSVTLNGKDLKVDDASAKLAEMGSDELDDLEIVPAPESSAEYKVWARHAWSIDPNRRTALTDNACGGGFVDARSEQSPIDVYAQSGDVDETGEETGIPGSVVEPRCFEHHEIRVKPGKFGLGDERVQKEILPSQLRLTYPDPEFEADGETLAADSKLPTADFPNGW